MKKIAAAIIATAIVSSCNEVTENPEAGIELEATSYTLGSALSGVTQCSDIERYTFEVEGGPYLLQVDTSIDSDIYDDFYVTVGQYDTNVDELLGLFLEVEDDQTDYISVEDGQYYIEIDGTDFSENCGISYEIQLSTGAAPSDDSYEVDNLFSEASPLPAYTTQSGVSWNLDLKTITIPDGYNSANVYIEATGVGVDDWGIVEAVVCSTEEELNCSYAAFSETDGSEIDTDSEPVVFGPGTYTLVIMVPFGFDYQGSEYDIYWEPAYVADDEFEENDSIDHATYLEEGETIEATQFDEDWYEIEVQEGYEHLSIELYFSHDEGDIDIDLVNSDDEVLDGSWGTSDNEFIDYTVSEPGTYYLVVNFGNEGNAYQLTWYGESTE